MREQKRDVSLDLIRALAAFLVLSVHFFLNNGYYYTPMVGKKMLLMTVVRTGFMVCVPLFLLLSGCLCRNKQLTKRYYLGLGRVLLTYGLAALFCLGFRCLYLQQPFSATWAGKELLAFTAAPYAWYVEMYIGLFLLIPFLNLMYNGLTSRRQKEVLIVTLLCLTSLPALTNLRHKLLPSWWQEIYPIAYYFLGAYLGEYKPKVSWKWGVPLLGLVVLAGGGYNYISCYGGLFRWEDYNNWFGPGIVASAALVFLLLRQLPWDKLPGWCRWLISKGAGLSLSLYLVSWCYDQMFYPILAQHVPNMPDRLFYYIAIVPAVYLCSALTAQVLEWIRKGITWGLERVFPLFFNGRAAPAFAEQGLREAYPDEAENEARELQTSSAGNCDNGKDQ
ncbi:MAG: acyltransferase family protein [Oscillospiraceae bacterium]|nr:acyltransferase family protein [Oscillospiraceae bacterium]